MKEGGGEWVEEAGEPLPAAWAYVRFLILLPSRATIPACRPGVGGLPEGWPTAAPANCCKHTLETWLFSIAQMLHFILDLSASHSSRL